MNNNEIKTVKEIVNKLSTDYYKKQIEQMEIEIENIQLKRPRYEGIYNSNPGEIVPSKNIQKEVTKLKHKIQEVKKNSHELAIAISDLKKNLDKMEQLAEKDVLIDALYKVLDTRLTKTEKNDVYEENKARYAKLHLKSTKPISNTRLKINKEMYKTIKSKLHERAYEQTFGYSNIKITLEDNRKKTDSIGNQAFFEYQNNYNPSSIFYNSKFQNLGVDVSRIKFAREKLKGDIDADSIIWDTKNSYENYQNLEYAKKLNLDINIKYGEMQKLENKYTELLELSREAWYLNEIVESFRNTSIKNTEMYQGLKEMLSEQKQKIHKLVTETDKLYKKTGFEDKVEFVRKLNELNMECQQLKTKINQFNSMNNFEQLNLVQQKYYAKRYEMTKILLANPDLNKPIYDINLEQIRKKEMELFEPELKKGIEVDSSKIQNNTTHDIDKKDIENIPVIDKKNSEQSNNKEGIATPIKKTNEEINSNIRDFEMEPNLQIYRTYHYQNYMREKVLNSNLGKLSFSAYLEIVAPHLKELINIEKERENLAKPIFMDYLKYYSLLNNKKEAISFYEFAKNNYNISNIDVPIEYDEEYKGMKK